MKNKPQLEANRLTNLWQEHGPNTYPIDLEELIDGAITKSGFPDSLAVDQKPFESIEGSLIRTKNTRNWTILINSKIGNTRRRRFTLAHELGHFMCHRDIQDRFQDNEESLNNFRNEMETEANVFASSLLMPANLIRSEFGTLSWDIETLQAVGRRFECSLQASALRYVELSPKAIAFVVSRDGMVLWARKSRSAPFISSFCFGDELPPNSQACGFHHSGGKSTSREIIGSAWCDGQTSFESHYLDRSGLGYQYTCIDFR